VTVHDARFAKVETQLAIVRGELALLRWMVGFALALLAAIVIKLFLH
jgi:hypothetical protein